MDRAGRVAPGDVQQHMRHGHGVPAAAHPSPVLIAGSVTSEPAPVPGSLTSERGDAPPPPWGECCWEVLVKAAPSMLSVVGWYAIFFASLAVVGATLGPEVSAGCGLGFFCMSMVALYPGMGLTFAVDTLCAQLFGQDPESPAQGEVAQRSMLVSAVYLAPISVGLLACEPVLAALYEPALAATAAAWLRCAPLFLVASLGSLAMSKFLNNMQRPHLSTASLVAAAVASPALTWLLAPPFGPGGACIAMGLAGWVQFAVLALIIRYDPVARRRFGPLRPIACLAARRPLVAHLRLALPSLVFVAVEASSFDLTAVFAGTLGVVQEAAWNNVLTTLLYFQSTSAGFSIAASALVGAAVGAGRKRHAKRLAAAAVLLAFGFALLDTVLVLSAPEFFFSLLADTPAIAAEARRLLWLVPLFHVGDCVQFVFQGIFSGAGRNDVGAKVLLGALWGVGVPLAFVLRGPLGVVGICTGLTAGLWVEVPLLVAVVRTFDWEPHEGDTPDDGMSSACPQAADCAADAGGAALEMPAQLCAAPASPGPTANAAAAPQPTAEQPAAASDLLGPPPDRSGDSAGAAAGAAPLSSG